VKGGSISSNAPFGTSNEPTNYFTEHRKLWTYKKSLIMMILYDMNFDTLLN
jgi:hypothetical protein